jgi:hypothetical protein
MRSRVLAILVILVAAAVFCLHNSRQSQEKTMSAITFQDVDRMIDNSSSGTDAEEWSRRLRGTRVRWTGTVTGIDEGQTIYVATNVFPTDIQFDVPKEIAANLIRGQVIGFTGTVEKVSDAETSPPMAHTYIFLKDVQVEKQ